MQSTSKMLIAMIGVTVPCAIAYAADHPCDRPISTPRATLESTFATGDTRLAMVSSEDIRVRGAESLSNSVSAAPVVYLARAMQEVNLEDLKAQIEKGLDRKPPFSPKENERQAQSNTCNAAYDRLLETFQMNVAAMNYPIQGKPGLAMFARWYYDAQRPAPEKAAAQPVVQAQLAYEKACLVNVIPPEMDPEQMSRAVGVFSFERQPFCSGLRESDATVITAKHCFFKTDGSLELATALAQAGKGKLWFQFEAEPTERYEVCLSSLPKAEAKALLPVQDNIRVSVAKSRAPVANWKWSTVPISNGTSLYMRGHFPFGDEADSLLSRMRSTALGGCAAYDVHEGCVFHGCQAVPSMSGAPVFYRPDSGASKELQVVGLHLGTAALSRSTEPGGTVCSGSEGAGLGLLNFAYQPRGL